MKRIGRSLVFACAVSALMANADLGLAAERGAESSDESGDASPVGEQQTIGHWVVTATDDGAGNFVNCTAFGVYGEEQLILSHTPQGNWEFGLWRPDWNLNPSGSYFLWYNVDTPVDGPGVMKRPVEAAEPERIFFEVSSLESLIERAAQGEQLNLQLRGLDIEPQSLSYSLDRAGEALEETQECTRRNLQTAHAGKTETATQAPQGTDLATTPAAPSLPPLGEQKIEEFDVPGWQGGAYADANSGAFTHCSILAAYQNGTVLGIARMANGSWLLALHRTDWTLSPGEWSPIRYSLAGEVPMNVEGEAQAVNANILAVNMGRDDWLVNALRATPQLQVATQNKELVFDISDVGPGLDALQDCAARHAEADGGTDAPDGSDAGEGQADASEPGILEQGAVEDWTLAAFANNQGDFSHCAAYAVYQNGLELYLIQDDVGTWRIALFRESWDRESGTRQPLRYRVDANPFTEAQAVAPNPTTLFIEPEGGNLDSIASGRQLVIEIEGERFAFDLENADRAVPAVAECVGRHRNHGAKAAADSNAETTTDGSDLSQAETRKEAEAYAAALLEQAGYSAQDVLSRDQVPEGVQQYDAVWRIADVVGGLTVQPAADGVTAEAIREMLFVSDAANCEGRAESGDMPGSDRENATHFFSRCERAGGDVAVFYNVMPRPEGGFYIATLIPLGEAKAAEAISLRLNKAAAETR